MTYGDAVRLLPWIRHFLVHGNRVEFRHPTLDSDFMRVLISGAGIAGPTLAYWLAHYGFTPTIVEKAPRLRTGGYIIDFWGAGFDIAIEWVCCPRSAAKGTWSKSLGS